VERYICAGDVILEFLSETVSSESHSDIEFERCGAALSWWFAEVMIVDSLDAVNCRL
jgi:hypothetical protein